MEEEKWISDNGTEWISVKDRKPDERYETEYWVTNGDEVGAGTYAGDGEWLDSLSTPITAWVPLPKRPKGD